MATEGVALKCRYASFATNALAALVLALACCLGCRSQSNQDGQQAVVSAEPIDVQECAACGMVVREQPAPRGQVVHRDGTRAYFCSLGDMLQYIKTPSPHGAVAQVFVELLDPSVDPNKPRVELRPWAPAEKTTFVVGVPRPGIMGKPVLAYGSAAEAATVAKKHGGEVGEVKSWRQLEALPLAGP